MGCRAAVILFGQHVHPVQPVCILMEAVVGHLVPNEQKDQDTKGYCDSQTENVDKGKDFPFDEASRSNLDVILKHLPP